VKPRSDHPITRLESRRAWESRWYSIRKDRIQLPGGGTGEYNVVEAGDAVWILPLTAAGEVVLLYQYRYTLGKWIWELPSGGIERGGDPLEAAQRELLEEAGGSAPNWRFLMRVATMMGIGDQYGYLYQADDVKLGDTAHEPAEVINVHLVPVEQAVAMARAGEIEDAISALMIMLAFGS
jgi:ADP-ribose pyrophosphatase